MGKVFSYVRFSSAKQAAGDSFARQTKAARAFADEHGLELADSKEYLFFDAGRSAYKGRHLDDTGELARFLGYVQDGSVPAGSVLVVESLDRLSRERVRDALPRFLDLLGKGISVYTSTDRRLYTREFNEIDLIISIISMSRAHEESAIKGARVSSAWRNKHREARETGKPLGKLRPLWLDVTPEGYVLNEEKAAIVRRMFDLSAQGYGSRVIAAKLNQEGIPAFSAGRKNFSGLWGFSTIRHILDSRTVLGEYQPHIFVDGVRMPDGEPIKGMFPAVVTEDEFYRAQGARASRRTYRVTKTTKDFNLLAGILRCYECGALMHLQGQNGRKYFKCSHAIRGLCGAGIIGAPRAEQAFREILAKLDSLSLVQSNSGAIQKQLQVIEGRIEEARAKQASAEDAHNEFPSRVTAKLLHDLEGEIAKLETDRDSLQQQVAADRVLSKEDFFQRLDLITYAGRAAANNLAKRLGTHVYALKRGRLDEMYTVSETAEIPAPFSPGFDGAMFQVVHVGKDLQINALQDRYTDLQEAQGELTPLQALLDRTESWDELPPDVLESMRERDWTLRVQYPPSRVYVMPAPWRRGVTLKPGQGYAESFALWFPRPQASELVDD